MTVLQYLSSWNLVQYFKQCTREPTPEASISFSLRLSRMHMCIMYALDWYALTPTTPMYYSIQDLFPVEQHQYFQDYYAKGFEIMVMTLCMYWKEVAGLLESS